MAWYKFLIKNVYSKNESESSDVLCNLKNFWMRTLVKETPTPLIRTLLLKIYENIIRSRLAATYKAIFPVPQVHWLVLKIFFLNKIFAKIASV